MKQYILGTEGNQPFKITQKCVSHQHARITISDDGVWTLEDLNSTNGTFIRDEKGNLRRVGTIEIRPLTFICLGPNNANGCSFYAIHLQNGDNYMEEFEYLNRLENEFEAKQNNAEKMAKGIRMLVAIASLVAFVGSYLVKKEPYPIILLRLGSALSAFCTLAFDPNQKIKKLQERREKFYGCPNPKCSHLLSSRDIRMMQCSKCKCG